MRPRSRGTLSSAARQMPIGFCTSMWIRKKYGVVHRARSRSSSDQRSSPNSMAKLPRLTKLDDHASLEVNSDRRSVSAQRNDHQRRIDDERRCQEHQDVPAHMVGEWERDRSSRAIPPCPSAALPCTGTCGCPRSMSWFPVGLCFQVRTRPSRGQAPRRETLFILDLLPRPAGRNASSRAGAQR